MRIAAYQFAVTGDMVENFEKIKNAILLAKKNAVQLLVFPECVDRLPTERYQKLV